MNKAVIGKKKNLGETQEEGQFAVEEVKEGILKSKPIDRTKYDAIFIIKSFLIGLLSYTNSQLLKTGSRYTAFFY